MGKSEIEAGKAFILLRIRDHTQKGLKQVQANLTRFSLKLGIAGAGITGLGIGLARAFRPAVTEFARIEQLLGRFDAVMGSLRGTAGDWAEELATSINQSSFTIKDQLAQFQNVYQGLGFNAQEAFVKSKQSVINVQDLIAFDDNISDPQDAVDKILGGITGTNVKGVRNALGALIQVADLQKELDARGDRRKVLDLGQKEKTELREAIIQRAFEKNAAGQALREVNTLASRLRGLAAAFQDTKFEIGKTTSSLGTLVRGFSDAVRGVGEYAKENPRLFQAIAIGIPVLIGLGLTLTATATALFVFGGAFGALANIAGVLSSLTIGAGVIAGIGTAAGSAVLGFDSFKASVGGALGFLREEFKDAWKVAKFTLDGIVDSLNAGHLETAGKIAAEGLGLTFEVAFDGIRDNFTQLTADIAKNLLALSDLAQNQAKSAVEQVAIDLPAAVVSQSIKGGKQLAGASVDALDAYLDRTKEWADQAENPLAQIARLDPLASLARRGVDYNAKAFSPLGKLLDEIENVADFALIAEPKKSDNANSVAFAGLDEIAAQEIANRRADLNERGTAFRELLDKEREAALLQVASDQAALAENEEKKKNLERAKIEELAASNIKKSTSGTFVGLNAEQQFGPQTTEIKKVVKEVQEGNRISNKIFDELQQVKIYKFG